jgi:hypothetical protein
LFDDDLQVVEQEFVPEGVIIDGGNDRREQQDGAERS